MEEGPADEGDNEGDNELPEESERSGKTNTPCRPLLIQPFPRKGRPTVRVAGGNITAGLMKPSEEQKRIGWEVQSSVNVERNVDR